jgi:hypothetical protein
MVGRAEENYLCVILAGLSHSSAIDGDGLIEQRDLNAFCALDAGGVRIQLERRLNRNDAILVGAAKGANNNGNRLTAATRNQ